MTVSHTRALIGCGVAASLWILLGSAVSVLEPRQAAPPQAGSSLPRFHHVHLNAVNPAASIQFYSTHFKSEKATFAGMDAIRTPNGWLLFNKTADAPINGTDAGLWHIGWGSSDTKSQYDRLLAMGTRFGPNLTEIKSAVDPRQRYFVYAHGPADESIEIFAESGGDEFEHIHLRAADIVAAEQWYVIHLGATNAPPVGGPATQPTGVVPPAWIDHVAFRFQRTPGRATFESSRGRVFDHVAFSVDNLEQTLARFQKEGVRVVEAPHTILGGALRSAFIEAPDSVQIELVEDRATRQ